MNKKGDIYLADQYTRRVFKVSKKENNDLDIKSLVVGKDNAQRNELSSPVALILDSNDQLYIVDSGMFQILKVTEKEDGTVELKTILGGGDKYGDSMRHIDHLFNPQDIAFDLEGNLFISDTSNGRIGFIPKELLE